MPIVEVTYYQAVCDGCGTNITEAGGHEYSAWSCHGIAYDEVTDCGGFTGDRGEIACEGCRNEYVATLAEVEADRLDDREYWAVAAFRGWLTARRTALQESQS